MLVIRRRLEVIFCAWLPALFSGGCRHEPERKILAEPSPDARAQLSDAAVAATVPQAQSATTSHSVEVPAALAGEVAPQDGPNYFGKGLSAGGTVTFLEHCRETARRSNAAANIDAYCACMADASSHNVGNGSLLIPERHAPTKAQWRLCAEFAYSAPTVLGTGTPFNRDGFGGAIKIESMVRSCERQSRASGQSWAYTIEYCACTIDAVRSHGDRLYLTEGEKGFCSAVATNWDQARRHLTRSQANALKARYSANATKNE